MTKNQIEYAKILEDQRYHNADIDVRRRRNSNDFIIQSVQNQLNKVSLDEAQRHNIENERIANINANENIRHNIASEVLNRLLGDRQYALDQDRIQLQAKAVAETERSNKARERQNLQQLKTDTQFKYQQLAENVRNQKEMERQGRANLKETKRANVAREKENSRSNKAREKENLRSNKAREKETARSNEANESIRWSSLYEQVRSNKANESLGAQRNSELSRSNRANEEIAYTNANIANQNSVNNYVQSEKRYQEEVRHNKATEGTNQQNATTGTVRSILDNAVRLIPLITRKKVK